MALYIFFFLLLLKYSLPLQLQIGLWKGIVIFYVWKFWCCSENDTGKVVDAFSQMGFSAIVSIDSDVPGTLYESPGLS